MAMPEGYDGMRTGDESERTDDPNVYKRTCIDFIEDISHDYEAWVDYYKLPEDEDMGWVLTKTCRNSCNNN